MLSAVLIVVAIVAAAFAAKYEDAGPPQTRREWVRIVAYWVFTIPVAFEMAAGGIWDLLRIEYVRVVLSHLGYPLYLLYILGIPKIPCALVLLLPRFPRLKEWAYAGAFFNYAGAAASHLLVGDGEAAWLAPLALSAFTIAPPVRSEISLRLDERARIGNDVEDALIKPLGRDRFREEFGHAGVARHRNAPLLGVPGQHDDGGERIALRFRLPDHLRQFETIKDRHRPVSDDDIGNIVAVHLQRGGAVLGLVHLARAERMQQRP